MSIYPQEYIDYLYYFHVTRDYFECHEVMEEFWKEHPLDPYSRTYVGLIQIAVGLYHHRRGNTAGALKMLQSSLRELNSEHLAKLGINAAALKELLHQRIASLGSNEPEYQDIDLPIQDPILVKFCREESVKRGQQWGQTSAIDHHIIHKHTLRDRSEVIAARKQQLSLRQQNRGGPSS